MSIEFYCKECYQKVVTPDATAGKKGRCPFCSKVVEIPLQSESQAPTQPSQQLGLHDLLDQGSQPQPTQNQTPSSLGNVQGATVVGGPNAADDGWRETQKIAKWGEFAGESKYRRLEEMREVAKRTLALPATGIIISAVFGMVFNAIYILAFALSVAAVLETEVLRPEAMALNLFFIICNISIHTMMIIGANHMRMTRSYTTAIAGSILAILPLPLNLVCPISAIFGVWSLILLARSDIRIVFKRM